MKLEVHAASYVKLGLGKSRTRTAEPMLASDQAIADMGAKMDICSPALLRQLGIDPTSLVPVPARIFGTSNGAKIDIIGGIILKISNPFDRMTKPSISSVVCLFYMADNISNTYSLATLKTGSRQNVFPKIRHLAQFDAGCQSQHANDH